MTLTIGEVAKQTRLSPKAIRLYEAHGLIPPPQRTEAGYRTYDQHDLALLRFVGQARALDLRLEETKRSSTCSRTAVSHAAGSLSCSTPTSATSTTPSGRCASCAPPWRAPETRPRQPASAARTRSSAG